MAKVAVYNMEGKEVDSLELNDAIFSSLQTTAREHRRLRPVPKYAVVVENHGDRREPDMQDRVQPELRSGHMVA